MGEYKDEERGRGAKRGIEYFGDEILIF